MSNDFIDEISGLEELKKKIMEFPVVFLYGAGVYGRRLLKFMIQMGIDIRSIVVTSKENNPDKIGNYQVITLDQVHTEPKETLFLLGTGNLIGEEIKGTLESRGYTNYINPPKSRLYYDNLHLVPKLEITTRIGCSVNCKYCPQEVFCTNYLKDSNITVMRLETFKKCVDKMPSDAVITFSGFSEPFLNDECVEMMQYAADQGRAIELYTTLVGLSMEKLEKIRDIEFKTVVLHTPDDKGYANIPMTKEYFEILDYALDMVGRNGLPWIDSANCQGVPASQFIEFARGRVIVKSSLCDRAGNLKGEEDLKQALHLNGRIKCSRMEDLNQWVLLPDGRVVVCCMDFGMRHILGNLEEQSYEELKTGKELYVLKEGLMHQEIPILCRNCTWAVANV